MSNIVASEVITVETRAFHPVMAQLTHDEAAQENFLVNLRTEVVRQWQVELRKLHTTTAGRAKDRHEILRTLLDEEYGKTASALRVTAQEMMWDSIGACVERQLPDLEHGAVVRSARGSLTLDPTLPLPHYVGDLDIHGMPGGYGAELNHGCIFAGAMYERGGVVRSMRRGGPLANASGKALEAYVKSAHAGFTPRRILDVGCSIGHSTLAICDAFPDAEVQAIDVAAPLLRYAHARAEAFGRTIHFSQQNAEKTAFEDGSFDLVVGLAMLHETSAKAMQAILNEAHRLLRSGGIVLHYEGRPWDSIDPFDAAVHDWDTHYNAEPFIGKMHDLDTRAMMVRAGFDATRYIEVTVPSDFYGTTASKGGGRWFFGAIKN